MPQFKSPTVGQKNSPNISCFSSTISVYRDIQLRELSVMILSSETRVDVLDDTTSANLLSFKYISVNGLERVYG